MSFFLRIRVKIGWHQRIKRNSTKRSENLLRTWCSMPDLGYRAHFKHKLLVLLSTENQPKERSDFFSLSQFQENSFNIAIDWWKKINYLIYDYKIKCGINFKNLY